MKFSYQWLSELVPGLAAEPAALQRLITMKTAECEGIEAVGGHFANVVAARVLTVEPLPKGKNKLVTIDVGLGDVGFGRPVSVICGAENVRPAILVPWVPPGTSLGGNMIGRAVFDLVESEGMLASGAELGLSRDHAGLLELTDVAPGHPLPGLSPDWIIAIDNKSLTHRPDLWGHYGMAREVAAITGQSLLDPVKIDLLPHGKPVIAVEIASYTLCPRYSALVFDSVSVCPSPLWLQARLEHLGLNPINNIVDVTNFILAELPQPMHAFDADRLKGDTIFVRNARAGETLRALNGETYTLHEADLVIADAAGPVALAGVIGGADSAISSTTRRIVLESANFEPTRVRFTSARHKLRTDASMRFEKSLDSENTLRGLARAVELLQSVCPGIQPIGGVTDSRGPAAPIPPVALSMSFVVRKLGTEISQQRVTQILNSLGFRSTESAPGLLTVTIPTWRATKDISLKEDLVEEIGRMLGYGEIVPTPPLVASVVPPRNPARLYLRDVRSQLAAQGFTEVHNYSFVNQAEAERFQLDIHSHIAVRNPIASELTHLRRSLLPGIYKNILTNVRHYPEFRLFEIGREIHPASRASSPVLPLEVTRAIAALYSSLGDGQGEDFFELKRVLECLFPGARASAAEPRPYEHPVRAAAVSWNAAPIGRLFELHPSLLKNEGIPGRAVLFDVDLDAARQIAAARPVKYTPLRKYPTSGFDLSVLTALSIPVAGIQDELTRLAGPHLALIDFIRQYDGPPLPQGQKSVTYRLEIGALDHTMSTEEVSEIRNGIIDGMRAQGFDFRA